MSLHAQPWSRDAATWTMYAKGCNHQHTQAGIRILLE
jgi:hypothetical protein